VQFAAENFDTSTLHYSDFELASPGGKCLSSLHAPFECLRDCFTARVGMFVTHDFSWEEHAYALLQKYYPAGKLVPDSLAF
jgi:hypothetical protein